MRLTANHYYELSLPTYGRVDDLVGRRL